MSIRATPLTMIWKLPITRVVSPAIFINPTYFDFLWLGDISGNYLMNSLGDGRKITVVGMDWIPNSDPTSNIIPESTTARFHLDHDADFILDDCTDYLWFNVLTGTQRDTTHAEMIADNYRTLIKYSNTAPFNITAIGILKSSVILTQPIIDEITTDFWLWVLWNQIWNYHGYLKNNRIMWNSNIVAIGTGTLTPRLPNDAPSGLSATPVTSSRIDLSWTNPAGTYAGIRVYRSVDNINFTLIDTIAYGTSYSATGLTSAIRYYFKVQAYSGLFTTIYSNTADSYPMLLTPTGLTLTLLHGGVRVSWTPGLAADNVEVYGKSDSGSYSLLGTITSGTIQYEDFLTSVDLRYYRLRAINGTRYSVYCTEQSVAMLGSELIANGTFGDATGWSLGTGWTISSGQLHFNGLAWTQAAYNLTLVIGHQYKMVIDVSNYATSATIYNGGGMIPAGPTFANGTITKWCGPSISAPYIAIVSTTDGSMDCDNLSIKENYAYGIPPSNLTVSWENDYAVMDFIDNSGGTLKHEIYEAEGVGAYNLVATLNEGVTHYHNYTSQGVMMHYRVRAIINSFVSEYTGYSNVVDYETPLVFQTDQSPVSAELDLYLDLVSVYGSTAVTIDWGDGTTPTVYTPPFSAHIYKTYTVAQDPYYVKIWGGGIITTLFMPVNAVIKGNLSKWKRSFLNLQIAYTSADSLPEVSTGAWGFAVDNYYANTHLSTYPRGEFITLDYYYARGGYASQAEVDAIYADLNTYYATHTPTKNIAIRINGGYYQVTGGDANADVIGIKAKFTAAGFTATIFTTA